ncbi:HAD family hydrolase [Halorubellus sp. PRR65]|uniref:HAD family hydrolase n=1 Tax=Halorubellus sp. PRR65 TaxID=3098148 RepID=UPI002B256C5F|nr:HAD family hydrolase [Halorubellus sp. PRR65]
MTDAFRRAVFFDLDHTLLEFETAYATVLRKVTERHLGGGDEAFEVTYSDRFLELLGDHADDPYRRAFEHALAEHDYADAVESVDALVATLREREVAGVAPAPGIERVLAELGGSDVGVGVLTNGVPDFQLAKLRGNDLDGYVDATVVSYEAGAHKPDERPFALAAERLPAEEYVMVGDSYEADVEGARAMGWRGIHYAPDGDSPASDPLKSFDDLLDRLN